jgi:hypothetical protein
VNYYERNILLYLQTCLPLGKAPSALGENTWLNS